MGKKTIKDMLTKLVQAAIDGGFRFNKERPEYSKIHTLYTEQVGDELNVVVVMERDGVPDPLSFDSPTKPYIRSIAAFILNRDFMRAVYGEKKVCWPYSIDEEDNECFDPCERGEDFTPVYITHTMQAAKLSVSEGIEKAVKYLYDNLPKGGSDENISRV